MIAIVDYGAGNIASVYRVLTHLGADARITADPAEVLRASRVVFPGQGHFGQAIERLRRTGLDDALRQTLQRGVPFLGICLGLQLLFEGSDEAPEAAGLGLLPGRCVRFGGDLRVPQVGWNSVDVLRQGTALDARPNGEHYYFVHSYHAVAAQPSDVLATADYGGAFTAAVARDQLLAVQFHPEKSGQAGLDLLQAWLSQK